MAPTSRSPRRYPRTARVNEVVREVLADALERLSDPRLEMVTITDVAVTPDLRQASVYYTTHSASPAEAAGAADGVRAAASHLRAMLGREVRLKYLPELHFHEDPAIATGERVEAILRSLRHGAHERPEDER
jgi:ribosome-binding factor A